VRNLSAPTTQKQIAVNKFGIKDTRQTPLAFRWWEPGCNTITDADDGCTGEEPPLVNGWAQPSPPLERFAFRMHADGSLEFKGHLNAAGASSGTVAFTLPGANAGEVHFLLPNSQFFHTTITTVDGSSFSLALVHIDKTTGDVTITWPAT
jgi:hypothetical protein